VRKWDGETVSPLPLSDFQREFFCVLSGADYMNLILSIYLAMKTER
jgi:hypothetical protein